MRVLISTELYTPSAGGQEVRYTELAEALVAVGHEVTVLCIRHAADLPQHEVRNGVEIFRSPLAPNYLKPRIKAMRRQVVPLCRFALWSRQMMRRGVYDLVIFNEWPLAHIVVAPKADRAIGIIDWCEARHSRFFSLVQRWLPRLTRGNIAVSSAVQTHLASLSGRDVVYIPSGVHCARYHSRPRDERQDIVYLGRITEHKNLPFLVAAFERLKDRGYPHGLRIAGSGPNLDELRRVIAASPYACCITLLGHVSDEEKIRLLSSSEVLALPSRREGFPRVVAEAMASGLPTVTPAFPGNGTATVVREYACGEVCSDSPEDMALRMELVLAKWMSYSRIALERSKELEWGNLLSRVEHLAQTAVYGDASQITDAATV
jgi:glycosyltransferase involved in cell wall biosynthesis